MSNIRAMQKWLVRSITDIFFDLICPLFEASDGTEELRVSSLTELARALITGEGESAHVQLTRSIVGAATEKVVPKIEWFYSGEN